MTSAVSGVVAFVEDDHRPRGLAHRLRRAHRGRLAAVLVEARPEDQPSRNAEHEDDVVDAHRRDLHVVHGEDLVPGPDDVPASLQLGAVAEPRGKHTRMSVDACKSKCSAPRSRRPSTDPVVRKHEVWCKIITKKRGPLVSGPGVLGLYLIVLTQERPKLWPGFLVIWMSGAK